MCWAALGTLLFLFCGGAQPPPSRSQPSPSAVSGVSVTLVLCVTMGALVTATESQRGLPHVARHGVPPPRRNNGFGGFFWPPVEFVGPTVGHHQPAVGAAARGPLQRPGQPHIPAAVLDQHRVLEGWEQPGVPVHLWGAGWWVVAPFSVVANGHALFSISIFVATKMTCGQVAYMWASGLCLKLGRAAAVPVLWPLSS